MDLGCWRGGTVWRESKWKGRAWVLGVTDGAGGCGVRIPGTLGSACLVRAARVRSQGGNQ